MSVVVVCADLDAALAFYVEELGFRLDMIMPADAPRMAEVSGHGVAVRLVCGESQMPAVDNSATDTLHVSRANGEGAWVRGRAGMEYRDLIAGRLGGRVIASHIRIAEGGEVPDYVHHHRVRFQMIYCHRGWVRVVYEDQGAAFVMHAGDCVLQPPGIRHRVLEASAGLEVVEIGLPVEHETFRDHEMILPNGTLAPLREFDGQVFVRHCAEGASWAPDRLHACEVRDTGIAGATRGVAGARVLRMAAKASQWEHNSAFLFLMVLSGRLRVGAEARSWLLEADDACVLPQGARYQLDAPAPCEVLEVTLPKW